MPLSARSPLSEGTDDPQLGLRPTSLLDLQDPKLRLRVQALTQLCKNEREKALAIYGFVKRLPLTRRVKLRAHTVYHPVGSCRMGKDERAVVQPDCRVRGMDGLRVADASIMPNIVGGNTNAPCIAIGERAAAFIRAQA